MRKGYGSQSARVCVCVFINTALVRYGIFNVFFTSKLRVLYGVFQICNVWLC